jgi:hypothetical protein
MAVESVISNHIQQQFASFIQVLRENVDQNAARAYLKSLCTDASLDRLLGGSCRSKSAWKQEHPSTPPQSEEDIWRTFTSLNDNDVTYDTNDLGSNSPLMADRGPSSSPALNSLGADLFHLISQSTKLPSPLTSLSVFNSERPFILSLSPLENKPRTLCQACTCEKCKKAKIKNIKTKDNTGILDPVIRDFLYSNLTELLSEYWETLQVNGLYYHGSAESFEWSLCGSPVHIRRLHYHLILEHLGVEDDLYQWRRSIAEINNLNSYEAFVTEAEA